MVLAVKKPVILYRRGRGNGINARRRFPFLMRRLGYKALHCWLSISNLLWGFSAGLNLRPALIVMEPSRLARSAGRRSMLLSFFIRTICLSGKNHHDTNNK